MIKLWLKAFYLIYKREGFKSAWFLMVYARRERSKQELLELVNLLEDINEQLS